MADNNTAYPLRLLSDIGVNLLDCEHKTPKPAANGYPYIAIPNIQDGRLDLTDVRRITESDFKEWTKKIKPQAGDIIVTRRGRVGDTAVVPSNFECAIGQNLVILRSDNSIVDQRYLRWALRGPLYEQQVDKFLNVGAIFYSLNCRDIPKFEVPLPSLSEQKAIAHILGTLDDKIELNRRMNETLGAMARATFKSWFIDFDPVRAKMDGRRPAGMDEATAALFPGSFVECNGRLVPKGWKTQSLYKTAQYMNGAAFRNEHFCNSGEGLPVIKIAELKNGITDQTKFSNRDDLDPKYYIDTGELLYSWSGSPDTSLDTFLWTKGQGLLNQHIFKVITDTSVQKHFVYYLLRYLRPTLIEIARNKQTTGLGHVTVADMQRLLVQDPPDEVLSVFDKQVAPLFENYFLNSLESEKLATIRDTLLPKLLSGEIRVSEAEQTVAEVA